MSAPETMLQPGFFVIGGTLPRDAACYIRREADKRLYSSLCRGDICYALTPRQMGKSSLMVHTAAQLREGGVSVALLDLTAFGQNLTPDQWYNGLVGRIGQQVDLEDQLEDYWNTHLHIGPLQRWAGAIRDVVLRFRMGPVVIFIDEIDAVRSLPFSTDEFFAGIREFYNRRTQDSELSRLTFCLLGVATPSDLIRDTRTTPFNIGVRVELSDFTLEEATPLAQGLCLSADKAQQVIRRVLYWTGGHPYLTQRLCQAVSANCAVTPAAVDRACNELFLSHRARERDDNLLFVRERMLRNETDLAGLLLLYRKICTGAQILDDESNPLVTVLRLAGIVQVDRGYLRLRNRIYAEVFNKEWVKENLPGAEVRRQRAAYRRGIKIAGAAFTSVVLLAGAYELQKLYTTDTTPPTSPVPIKPAFWASFTTQSQPTSETGALLITTGGAGIWVFVNGAQYGRTGKDGALPIPMLPAGDYDVRTEKPGFQPVTQRAHVVAQAETRLSFKLSPLSQAQQAQVVPDTLLLLSQTPAGARVSVDGKAAGVTDADGNLSVKIDPGEHEIALDKAGYLPRDFKRRLTPGGNMIEAKMELDGESLALAAALRSNDLTKLQAFADQYPNSKSMSQVRAKMEDLEWSSYRDSVDPNQLSKFMDKYPNGQHIGEASRLVDQLAAEDMDWRRAQASNTIASLQHFLEVHPRSRHAADASSAIAQLSDRAAIAQLLRDYQDSYNRHDLKQLLQLWPTCPFSVQKLSALFKEKPSLSLSPKGDLVVKGDMAIMTVAVMRQTGTGDSSVQPSVPFEFSRQSDHWVIAHGSL